MKEKIPHKCLICAKGRGFFVKLTEHIITGHTDMKKGKSQFIHAKCLSNKLAIELPYGFIYGRIGIIQDEDEE
jgi:hypothetical protein